MNHDEMIRVLDEMLDVEIREVENKRDHNVSYPWLTREYDRRISLLQAVRARLKKSLLVNHEHFSMTISPETPERFTLIRAELARLRQEVRIYERDRLMARNDNHIGEIFAELRDKFKQAIFDPPKAEQTPPAQT